MILGWVSISCGSEDGANDSFPAEALYASDLLPTFELTLSDECISALYADPFTYCSGDIRYRPSEDPAEDVVLENVGIRLKGRASFESIYAKPSFKIKLDEYVDHQRLLGLRRLTFNNMGQDASMVRERLGYLLFREAGVPAPLCNHARIFVNGDYFGLYANVETLDDEFAEHRFSPAPGNLYDTSNDAYFVDFLPKWKDYFELETNRDVEDTSDLDALIEGVNGPSESFYSDADEVLDWDEFLIVGGVQALIADWDGYFGARNNYKIYHELGRDRFVLFPWGIDQTFGFSNDHGEDLLYLLHYPLDGSGSGRENGHVFLRCKETEACLDRYYKSVRRALDVWDSLALKEELDFILEQTAAARKDDTRKPYSDEHNADAVSAVRTFLGERGDIVAEELADRGY